MRFLTKHKFYFIYAESISWKKDRKKMIQPHVDYDSVILEDTIYNLGGSPYGQGGSGSQQSMEVLAKGGWRKSTDLPTSEVRGCSVAISPFEMITVQGTESQEKSKKVFKYDTRTRRFKMYQTGNGPFGSVSNPDFNGKMNLKYYVCRSLKHTFDIRIML